MTAARRYPVDRLDAYEKEIRFAVETQRAEGTPDEDLVVMLSENDRGHLASYASGERSKVRDGVLGAMPSIAPEFDRPPKPGHVTVVVHSTDGDAVFGVKIAEAPR